MAKNQVFKFVDVLSLPVPEGTKSGEPVVINAGIGLVGVAETDRGTWDYTSTPASGPNDPFNGGNGEGYASVSLKGAYRLPVTGALAVGDPVYITASRTLTATAGTNVRFGWSLDAKGTGTGETTVVIDGAPAAAAA